jgi:RHH-type proline utilization regulon transcriptional repressor/proline dehydrogenase/delta 1-pyrroline-5-carboxylate dehydrogenase
VFTRKAMTDVCLPGLRVAAAGGAADGCYPQFATHNALTVATVLELPAIRSASLRIPAPARHGRSALRTQLRHEDRTERSPCRVYAPVGSHRDLLAYLVRRLLENGANTSFVSVSASDEAVHQPLQLAADAIGHRHGQWRSRSRQSEDSAAGRLCMRHRSAQCRRHRTRRRDRRALRAGSADAPAPMRSRFAALQSIARQQGATVRANHGPALTVIGRKPSATFPRRMEARAATCVAAHDKAFAHWNARRSKQRARHPRQAPPTCSRQRRRRFHRAAADGGGKTLDDCARGGARGDRLPAATTPALAQDAVLGHAETMPGPTGEHQRMLQLHGRGVFVCISAVEFPAGDLHSAR